MSNCRTLKKDVNNKINKVINECFSFLDHSPHLNQENVQIIISDAVELRNKLIYMINNNGQEGNSQVSQNTYYTDIRKELCVQAKSLIERLDNLSVE